MFFVVFSQNSPLVSYFLHSIYVFPYFSISFLVPSKIYLISYSLLYICLVFFSTSILVNHLRHSVTGFLCTFSWTSLFPLRHLFRTFAFYSMRWCLTFGRFSLKKFHFLFPTKGHLFLAILFTFYISYTRIVITFSFASNDCRTLSF